MTLIDIFLDFQVSILVSGKCDILSSDEIHYIEILYQLIIFASILDNFLISTPTSRVRHNQKNSVIMPILSKKSYKIAGY